jgi:prolyl-tRNA synthetase
MGCYGIGVSRLIAAIIEQNNDAQGIIWPMQVSPFKVLILPLDITQDKIMKEAFNIHDELNACGIDTLIDDRDERAGVKFKDADLTGISFQVILGKNFIQDDKVELKLRKEKESLTMKAQEVRENIEDKLKQDNI